MTITYQSKLKNILLIGNLVILFSSINLHAQNHVFRPGLLLNFNGIHIEGDNNLFWDNENGAIFGSGGISYGTFVTYDTNRKFIGTLELRYIRKGSIYEFINIYGQRNLESLKMKYVEIPVLIGYKFNFKNRNLLLESGFSYAKLIRPEILFNELTKRMTTPNAGNFKKFDISWIVDLKYRISKNDNLLLGFRFEYSLLSVHNFYNLHNMNYGVELNYFLFKNKL